LFLKIIKLSARYRLTITAGLFFSLLFVLTNSAALWTVASLMDTVFQSGDAVTAAADPTLSAVETLPSEGTDHVAAAPDSAVAVKASELPTGRSRTADLNEKLKRAVSRYVMAESPLEKLTRLTLIIITLFFLKNLFHYLKGVAFASMELRLIHDLRTQLYAHITRQSMRFLDNRKRGEFISIIINDVLALRRAVNVAYTNMVTEPLSILAIVILLFIISWQFTLYIFIMFPVSALIFWVVGASMRRKGRRSFAQMARITDFLHQMFDGIRLIKALGKEESEIGNFQDKSNRYRDLQFRQTQLSVMSPALSEMIGVITGSVLFLIGGKMVLVDAAMDGEDFLRYIILLFSAFQPIKRITSINVNLQNGFAAGERIFGLLDMPIEDLEHPGAVDVKGLREGLRYENIRFRYEKDEAAWVLNDVSFEIRKGENVALVGASGSGKSTLGDLLLRFYLPDEGRISIDGRDIQDIRADSLRQLIGVVSQDVFLLNDTIRANILYGRPDASEQELRKAASNANALEFIESFEHGWDTVVGDRGVKLSGGQKQRISIARALLQDQDILILDEATSALDNESERMVQESLNTLMEGKTSLIIAHRLSTIQNADRILVLYKGRIICSGSHLRLMEDCPYYETLYQQQLQNGELND